MIIIMRTVISTEKKKQNTLIQRDDNDNDNINNNVCR